MTSIPKWTRPKYYSGQEWWGWGSTLQQHRDSNAVCRSNFRVFLSGLGGEDGENVVVVRENHCLVGWVEWIAIHPEAPAEVVERAERMLDSLREYPILDEEDLWEVENEEAEEVWSILDWRDRLAMFHRHGCFGEPGWREMLAAVRGDWGAASSFISASEVIR